MFSLYMYIYYNFYDTCVYINSYIKYKFLYIHILCLELCVTHGIIDKILYLDHFSFFEIFKYR